jgi:dienelactone hydrolase
MRIDMSIDMGIRRESGFGLVSVCLLSISLTGCLVGQRPGEGRAIHMREGKTGARYWLYLPKGYDDPPPAGQPRPKHPLVMTFHGMKPFDSYRSQIREWQQEADRYGFVVCAPNLQCSALLGPLPLDDPNSSALKRDERNTLAIMDEVYRVADVDPARVLATSWSYGGYVAHYMANRHPERFSCIAVKQSNFNANLLDPSTIPRYRDHKIGIFYTENDFKICREESSAAARWYAKNGFDLTFGVFEKKGHERTPGIAAEFFARACGIEAKTPPVELAQMQIKLQRVDVDGATPPSRTAQFAPPRRSANNGRPIEVSDVLRPSPSPRASIPGRPSDDRSALIRPVGAIQIRVNKTVGVAPMTLTFDALMPDSMSASASYRWTLDGQDVAKSRSGRQFVTEPGDHQLKLSVTLPNGRKLVASKIVSVVRSGAER